MKYVYIMCVLMVFLVSRSGFGQEKTYAIIAHPDVTEQQLDKSDLRSMFLGRKKQWKDGHRIVLAIHAEKTVFELFSRTILSKTMRQFVFYWKRMVMTGRGSMPKQFSTTADAVAFVAKTKGAVAIVTDAATFEGVKKIDIK